MKKHISVYLILVISLFTVIIISSALGSANLSVSDSLKIVMSKIPIVNNFIDESEFKNIYIRIVWDIRMPRIIFAGLVGCGLSIVGGTFQSIFRNPLADPHILGVSSGAALGATVAMLSGITINYFGLGVIGIFAFIGGILTVVLVYKLALVGNRLPVFNMLLTGTAVSTMLSSFIALMMSFNREKITKVYLWTMGSFSASNWDKVIYLAGFIIVGFVIIYFYSKDLDLIMTGSDTAKSLGVDTAKVKKILIVTSTLIVAACVSVSGIIGFVGLVIPHCVRLVSGPKHRSLIPLSALLGAIFMIICDTLARTLTAPGEIPVGVITALLGAPYFIFLIQHNKKERSE